MTDSRQFVSELPTQLRRLDDGRVQLLAPAPGLWRDAPPAGTVLRPGAPVGWLEVLAVLHRLRVPEGAVGAVVDTVDAGEAAQLPARRPVEHGTVLLTLDPQALGAALEASAGAAASEAETGALVLRAPSSGRFYRRPGPDKPPFIEPGQVLTRGQAVGLLEVMKTFTRVYFDDPRLPERARVEAVLAEDLADLDHGDPILRLAAVEAS